MSDREDFDRKPAVSRSPPPRSARKHDDERSSYDTRHDGRKKSRQTEDDRKFRRGLEPGDVDEEKYRDSTRRRRRHSYDHDRSRSRSPNNKYHRQADANEPRHLKRSRSDLADVKGQSSASSDHRDQKRRGDRKDSERIRDDSPDCRDKPRKRRDEHDKRDTRRGLRDDNRRHRCHRDDRSHSTSPHRRNRQSPEQKSLPYKRSAAPLHSQESAYAGDASTDVAPLIEKQKPNYAASGKLAAETNTVEGTSIVLKYNEPPESRKPPASADWRMFVFKGSETLETLELGTRSCWLFGRERAVADFAVDHPSCSKQHVVLQFRYVEKRNEYGDRKGEIRPYVIDLESANGTFLNGERIPDKRFLEIISGDMLKFGESSREYVVMLAPK